MQVGQHDIGVCSWSLRLADMAAMIAGVRSLGLAHCQLALTPLVRADEEVRRRDVELMRASGLKLPAGMISFPGEDYSSMAAIRRTGGFVPDGDWEVRRDIAARAMAVAAELGIGKISTHIGFVPPSNDERYPVMVQRVREIAELWAGRNIQLLLETGQEAAPELLQFLNDIPAKNVGVNFDPANMILYGAGDPIEAIDILGRHIGHVHVKDAVASRQPGVEWGREMPFGTGEVNPRRFLDALDDAGYGGALTIEREGRAANHIADIQGAIEALQK